MPLQHSGSDAAFKTNVKTLMGEVGQSPHVQSREQALAIAYATKRRGAKLAIGGFTGLPSGNWQERAEARNLQHAGLHTGPIISSVPGRTDNHSMSVPSSSYVLPADHVSSLGQGNTLAGMKVLGRMFPNSNIKHGMGPPKPPHMPGMMSDRGGARGDGPGAVPIMSAGGEFVVDPVDVANVGGGDVKQGHDILDHWVKSHRKKHVKTLSKLPPPAKT